MELKWLFLLLAILMANAAAISAFRKRRNYGYIVAAFVVMLLDVACFMLMGCKNIRDAREILSAYYILSAWLYTVLGVTVYCMNPKKHSLILVGAGGVCSLVQTSIIVDNLIKKTNMAFEKHIFFGKNWWIMEGKAGAPVLFSFSVYYFFRVLCILLIIIVIAMTVLTCEKMFRRGMYVIAMMYIMVAVAGTIFSMNKMPVWIACFFANICIMTLFYYVNYYYSISFKNGFRANFADELSDGFVLYDINNDFVYMNGMMEALFDEKQKTEFKDKAKLEAWLSHSVNIEGAEVLPFRKDGETRYFRLRTDSIDRSGKKTGTAYILHDTTESVLRLQAMRTVNEELERAAKMKSDFLANMSHEIRTPMNAVIGMAEIAMREDLPKNVMDYLAQIQSSGRNLLNIINDILDFSKIEAGKMEIVEEDYEPISEINDISNIMMTRIGDKPIEYFAIIDQKIPHVLLGDAMRIRQIIINLTNNAVKFTKSGLVILTLLVEEISSDEVMLKYHVIDTGQGIKKEDIDKLFVSFSQVDSKRNRSVEGTGLGLAISQRLVQAMGGEIGVESEYGKGSDFWFNIPQKIVDKNQELVVKDCEHKYAYVIDDRSDMVGVFLDEMKNSGVESKWIASLDEYVPTGKKEYLFFQNDRYGDDIRDFVKQHEDVTGVILVDFTSDFVPDLPNLRILRRPQTTIAMVMVLNDQDVRGRVLNDTSAYTMDFIAPDAKVLIVDDNEINITIAKGLIGPTKIQCYEALSGKQAIEMLEKEHFDIIFMDHMMPEMDGVDTTKIIREQVVSAMDTPIIALTANVVEGVKEMFIAAGMNDLVAKPIDIRSLVKCLKTWLPPEKIIEGAEDENSSVMETVSYDGLDCESAIRSLGSSELFKTVVSEYYRSAEDRKDAIIADFEHEDWEGYTIKVHALKSASRQIGAPELGSLAEEMEMAGKAGDIDLIKAKNDVMLEKFDVLIAKLSPYFAEEEISPEDLPPLSMEELCAILDKLDSSCEDLDMDEMEVLKDVLKEYSYPDGVGEEVKALCRAIDDLDTDLCAQITARIREM